MANTAPKVYDQPVYVRLPMSVLKRIDKIVARERREKAGHVDADAISRSSVIRSAVAKMLEETP
jgi:Arc/MetJ-type ribon-helix-helix transcriptional regulator